MQPASFTTASIWDNRAMNSCHGGIHNASSPSGACRNFATVLRAHRFRKLTDDCCRDVKRRHFLAATYLRNGTPLMLHVLLIFIILVNLLLVW